MRHGSPSRLMSLPATLILVLGACGDATAQASCPDAGELTAGLDSPLAHVRYLADDRLEGRAVGSEGERCAGDYLADRFAELGLEPAGAEGSWFQPFPIRRGSDLGPDNALSVAGRSLTLGTDWVPYGFSASGNVEGALVFGGHGLSSPGNPEDRYARMDVADRVVVVEWGDPDAPGRSSLRAEPHFKATVAAGRDAAALILLAPEGTALPSPDAETRSFLSIPVAVVSGARADAVRAAATAGETARLRTDVRATRVDARNVVALLPGSDPALRDEYVIVGAHYDHVGVNAARAVNGDSIFNGADDDASGVVAVLEAARQLAEGGAPRRSVIFVTFTGEENGMTGTQWYIRQPPRPLEQTVAGFLIEMIGRPDSLAGGPGKGWLTGYERSTMGEMLSAAGIAVVADPRPEQNFFMRSDNAPFARLGIPAHTISSYGLHTDYHRPSDEVETLDFPHFAAVINAVAKAVRVVADGPEVEWREGGRP